MTMEAPEYEIEANNLAEVVDKIVHVMMTSMPYPFGMDFKVSSPDNAWICEITIKVKEAP